MNTAKQFVLKKSNAFNKNQLFQNHNDYQITMNRNKTDRNLLYGKIDNWVQKKFQNIRNPSKIGSSYQLKTQKDIMIQKECKKLQRELNIKYSIENLIQSLPNEYFKLLIKYIIQKKLGWLFTPSITQPQIPPQLSLSYKLKQFYQSLQNKPSNLDNSSSNQNQLRLIKQQSSKKSRLIKQQSSKKSTKFLFKGSKSNFIFQLFVMVGVGVVGLFFEDVFQQIKHDHILDTQIYLIIIHVFLDFNHSPKAYSIMNKKYCYDHCAMDFRSLNVSCVKQLSANNHLIRLLSIDSKQNSNENKVNVNINISIKQPILNPKKDQIKQIHSTERSKQRKNTQNLSIIPIKRSTFRQLSQARSSQKRKVIQLKQTTSLNNSLYTKPHKLNPQQNFRFNSFLHNTKPLKVYPQGFIYQESCSDKQQETKYQKEEKQFCQLVKQSLHVQPLPPIIKKKLNIHQYDRLNQTQGFQSIKNYVEQLDNNFKNNQIQSNDLSLAMKAYIFTSTCSSKNLKNNSIEKRKQTKPNMKIINNKIVFQQDSQQINVKLPVRASHLTLKPQFSSGLYSVQPQKNQDYLQETTHNQMKKFNKTLSQITNNIVTKKQSLDFSGNEKKSQKQQGNLMLKKTIYQQLKMKKKKNILQWSSLINEMKMSCHRQPSLSLGPIPQSAISQALVQQAMPEIQKNLMPKKIQQIPLIKSQHKHHRTSVFPQFIGKQNQKLRKSNTIIGDFQQTDSSRRDSQVKKANNAEMYQSLQAQVNVKTHYNLKAKNPYKSFQLRHKLHHFQNTCKARQDKANYSIFGVPTIVKTSFQKIISQAQHK